MLKSELVSRIAALLQVRESEARKMLEAVIECMGDGCAEDGILIVRGLGTFKQSVRKARIGTKPGTNERLHYPESTTVTFKASRGLKDKVSRDRSG